MHGMTWKQEMHVIFDTAWHLLAAGENFYMNLLLQYLPVSKGKKGISQESLISFLSSSSLPRLKETTVLQSSFHT